MEYSKKSVFILNNFAIGGAEQLVLDLVAELSVAHEIHVITVLGRGPLEQKFRALPITLHAVSPSFSKSFLGTVAWVLCLPLTLLRLLFILRKIQPESVVTSLYHADVLGILGARLLGIKKRILVQHDIQKFSLVRKYIRLFFAIRSATTIVAISQTVAKFLKQYWSVPEEKIQKIQNGVRMENFYAGEKVFNPKHVVFGVVARLEEVKGHRTLLETLKFLKEKYNLMPAVELTGDGSLRGELEQYATEHQLDNVSFLGFSKNISETLKRLDVLVVPSLEEGFGLVVAEGLAARKVVVASNIGAFQELIIHEKNGVLFGAGESLDLAYAIKGLLENPDVFSRYHREVEAWNLREGQNFAISTIATRYAQML